MGDKKKKKIEKERVWERERKRKNEKIRNTDISTNIRRKAWDMKKRLKNTKKRYEKEKR